MMDWLSGLVGENTAHLISFIGLFVLFLMGVFVVYAAIKRMTAGTYVSKDHNVAPRLTVTDAAAVDGQRRLVLVRRDDVEHLILIGGPSDIVIEQNIIRHKRDHHENTAPRNHHQDTNRQDERIASSAPRAAASTAVQPAAQAATPVAAQAMIVEQTFSASADIISAVPAYKPQPEAIASRPTPEAIASRPTTEAIAARPRGEAPVTQATTQPLQTHAQQLAAARQQQATQQAQRPAAPRPAAPASTEPKLHPVYPLGQVSRGVIAATSGLAAANNAAQQELIAAAKRENRSATPSLDDVRPGTQASAPSTSGEAAPLVLQRATPQLSRPTQQEPSFGSTAVAQPSLDLDIENAVAQALSADAEMSFEDLLSSEMEQHFTNADKSEPASAEVKKPQSGMLNISPRE